MCPVPGNILRGETKTAESDAAGGVLEGKGVTWPPADQRDVTVGVGRQGEGARLQGAS